MNTKHLISSRATIKEALERLNSLPGKSMTLFVGDADSHILGTLTDGDIRRALLCGLTLEDNALLAAHTDFQWIEEGCVDVERLRNLRQRNITLIPVLDSKGKLTDVLDMSSCRTILPLNAVLMAGGRGERLRPATLTTPKPLLTIEGKAIIDYNIELLASCGIKDITVATGYLAEQIYDHFRYPVAGVAVKCVKEEIPLGTIGAVTLTDAAQGGGDTLVMNSDLITTVSFEEMYLHHRHNNAAVTIAVVPYQVSVPYAILALDDENPDRVAGIEEKPSYSYYANAGIYIFSKEVLRMLEPQRRCDATDLISKAIADGMNVSYYPIKGTWIDVGSPVDFRQASELMRHHNAMNS